MLYVKKMIKSLFTTKEDSKIIYQLSAISIRTCGKIRI